MANFSRGLEYIWNEVAVLVTFESSWEEILHALAGNDDIDFASPAQCFYDNPTEDKPGTNPAE